VEIRKVIARIVKSLSKNIKEVFGVHIRITFERWL